MDGLHTYLEQLPYWAALAPQEREALTRAAALRHYRKGALLQSCETACLGMIYVCRGSIRVYILSEEGREITLFRLMRGMPCVLSAACVIRQITFEPQMAAEQDCDLLVIQAGTFERLAAENIHVRCFMYELLTERFSSVMWTMQQILFLKFDQRLAAFLLSEYEKTGRPELRMTHEHIARQVNSAREVVARMLKRFAAEGLVELNRGSILLKNVDALRAI